MPIEYCRNLEVGLITVTATGVISVSDRAAVVKQIFDEPMLAQFRGILIDTTGVTNIPQSDESRNISYLVELLFTRFNGRLAYLVTTVGMVTPYNLLILATGIEKVRTFTNREEAMRWLGY